MTAGRPRLMPTVRCTTTSLRKAPMACPTVYVGYIINRSAAEVTDLATGLGNFRGLMSALGETRMKGCSRNRMPACLQAQPA